MSSQYKPFFTLLEICTRTANSKKIITYCDRLSVEKLQRQLWKKQKDIQIQYIIIDHPVQSPFVKCDRCTLNKKPELC